MKWIKKEETCRQFVQVKCPNKKVISQQNDSPSHVPLGRKGTTSQEKGKRGLSSLKEQLPYGKRDQFLGEQFPLRRKGLSCLGKRSKFSHCNFPKAYRSSALITSSPITPQISAYQLDAKLLNTENLLSV
jgi:hypothetical protein